MTFFKSENDLYANPELYDATDQSSEGELDFYLTECRRLGNPVLEVACGTGRVTNELAAHGIECEGLDLSESMLDFARMKAEMKNVSVPYHLGDMTDFDLGKKYGFIFVPLNSLLHLHAIDDLLKFFAAAAKHLLPGGELMFSIFNPSFVVHAASPGVRYNVESFIDPVNGKKIMRQETLNYDVATQVNHGTWYYSYADQEDVFTHSMNIRSIFPQELELLVRLANFKILNKYGGYDRHIFDSKSLYQIVSCAPV